MMAFGRVKPPAELRTLLASGERLLAIADDGPAAVAASQLGLWLPEADRWRRVGWDDVVKATWSQDGLQVIEGDEQDGLVTDLPTRTFRLDTPRNLPVVVRQRVEQSIARVEPLPVPGGSGRIVARRRPGQDGLRWTARLDAGTPDSAMARQLLADRLAELRAASELDELAR